MSQNLSPSAKSKALDAIQAMHEAWTAKDGLAALTARLETRQESAAAHIYGLALYACKARKLEAATVLFKEMCKHAETELKTRLQVDNLKDALPIWAVYKSNILRGMNCGIAPVNHTTEKSFRQATLKHLASQVTQPTPALVNDVDRFLLRDTTIAMTLRDPLHRLLLEAQYIKPSKLKQADEILKAAALALAALVDQRLVPDHEPTRSLLAPGSMTVQ